MPKSNAASPKRADVNVVIAETLMLDGDLLLPGANLLEDLNVDSLDVPELIVAFEDVFDVEISDAMAKGWITLDDIYATLGAES